MALLEHNELTPTTDFNHIRIRYVYKYSREFHQQPGICLVHTQNGHM